eukprot:TRINITY_DN1507_c0_g1_i11.p1 TRINITY_DN1507_c0_g1~~TRINITY_DN1507_c0_g1_i11.p1  ORF type:complete len:1829 (-),score=295.25 TRINITY_DN1507_c0_g1_i11:255-4994(-)
MTVVEYEDDFDDDGLELSIKEIISQEGTDQLAALLHSSDASTLHADDRRGQLSVTNFSSDEEDIDDEEPVLSAMNQLGADYAMNDAGTHMGMNTRVLGAIPATSTSLQSESPFSHPGVDVMMTAISTKSNINTPRRTSIVSSHTDSSDQVTAVLAALQREATVAASAAAMSQVNHLQAEQLPEGVTLGSTSAAAVTALQDAASVNGVLTADTNTLVQPGYNSMAALHSDKTCALATAVMPANISSALIGQQQEPTAQSDDRRCNQYGQCDPLKAYADSSIQIATGASSINNGGRSSIDVSTAAAACGASGHQHRLPTEVLISQIHSTATLEDAEECNSIGVAAVQHTLGRVDRASEASVCDSGFVDDVRHQLQQQQTLPHASIGRALGNDSSQVGTGAEQFRCSSANSNTTTMAAAPRRRRRSMVNEPASADISMGDAHQVAAAASAEVSSPPSRFIAAGSCPEGSVRPPDWLTKTATADPPAAAAALRTWAASDPLPDDKRRCGSGSSGTSSNSRRQRQRPLGSSFEPPRTVVDTADVNTTVPCLLAAVSAYPQGRAGTPQHDGRSTAVPTKASGIHVEVATDCHTGRRRHSDPPPHNSATVQVSNPQATQEPQSRQRRRHADATTDRSARRENHITYDAITAAQLKATQACEDDQHDVLGQLLLRERQNQLQAQTEEQDPVLKRHTGTCEEDKLAQAHLQLSWDSLSFLERNSKSRLGAAAVPFCRNADAADLKTCAEGAPEYGKPTTTLERAVKVSEALAKVQLVQAQLGALSAYSLAHQHTDAPEQQQPQPPLPLPPPTAMAAHDTPPLPDMGVANDGGCNPDNKHASISAQHQSLGHQRSSEFDESVELNEAAPLYCLHQVMPDVPFECPVLPSGCVLKMELLSTWGDPYYIGLAGVDLFDEQGQMVTLPDPVQQVVAHPCLKVEAQGSPGAADPRTADKLFDGVNDTCDDLHMWLAPHDAACGTTVTVQFHLPVTLSAMRIWNYSKSREHSYRGVRRARISLDSAVIFDGEIRKAAPGLPSVPERCELILFTLDEELVQRAEATGLKHLPLQQQQQNEDEAPESATHNSSRPTTAEVQMDANALPPARHVRHVHAQAPSTFDEVGTDAAYASEVASERVSSNAPEISRGRSTITDAVLRSAAAATSTAAPVALVAALATAPYTSGRMLRLRILSTWGSNSFCGLTGIAILEQVPNQTDPVCVSLGEDSICCLTPWSGASGLGEHLREPANLLDGNTQTLEQRHMWKAPFSAATGCTLQIDLGRYRAVAGIILWNYNRSDEDASIGARLIQLELDGSVLTQAIIRRAPGSSTIDYGQLIKLDRQSIAQSDGRLLAAVTETHRLHRVSYLRMPPHQDYETLMHPTGMLLQIVIHSSWGDHYYVGLDALEVMGADGKPLPLEPAQTRFLNHLSGPTHLQSLTGVCSTMFPGSPRSSRRQNTRKPCCRQQEFREQGRCLFVACTNCCLSHGCTSGQSARAEPSSCHAECPVSHCSHHLLELHQDAIQGRQAIFSTARWGSSLHGHLVPGFLHQQLGIRLSWSDIAVHKRSWHHCKMLRIWAAALQQATGRARCNLHR